MTKPFVSKKKAESLSAGVFLISLAAVAYTKDWWPGIMAAIGAALVVRQVFLGRIYDAFISLLVFGGIFVTIQFDLSWMPVLFIVAGIYVLFRAFTNNTPEDVEEEEEEIQKNLEEEDKLP
jgi:predicted membrane protein